MADVIAALMKTLSIQKADVMGLFAMWWHCAARGDSGPEKVRKLVLVSAPCQRAAWYPEVQAAMSGFDPARAEQMKQSPMYQIYTKIAPRPQDWGVLFKKLGELLSKDYNWSNEVAAFKSPTLLVLGRRMRCARRTLWSSSDFSAV